MVNIISLNFSIAVASATLLLLIQSAIGAIVLDSEVPLVREYAKQMIEQTDTKIKPCDNFGKYACGNMQKRTPVDMADLSERLLIKSEPKTLPEKQAKEFYLSCKNRKDISHVLTELKVFTDLGTIPLTKDLTQKNIAKLLGELNQFSLVNLEFDTEITMETKSVNIMSSRYPRDIEKLIPVLNLNEEQITKVKELNRKLLDLPSNEDSIEITNLESDMNEKVAEFDWNVFFESALNALGLSSHDVISNGYTIRVSLPSNLRDTIEIIKTSDSKAVAHLLMLKTLRFLEENSSCKNVFNFYIFTVYSKIVREDTRLSDSGKQITSLKTFNENFNNIVNQLPKKYPELKLVYFNSAVDSIISILSQNQTFEEEIDEFYKQFEPISSENYYANFIKIFRADYGHSIKTGTQSISNRLHDFLLTIDDGFDLIIKNKPMLYHIAARHNHYWTNLFSPYRILGDSLVTPDCLYNSKEDQDNHENYKTLGFLLTSKLSLNEYFKYLDENKVEGQKQNEVLEDLGLNNERAFFLAAAQNICEINPDRKEFAFNALKQLKEFSSAFGCKSGDPMYVNTCQLDEITTDRQIENLNIFLEKIKL